VAKFNKDNPIISVAMATFNGEKYLLNQLESISNQTLLPDELIITDDSSTDSTLDIIKLFSKKAKFKVKFFLNNSNIGYSNNFSKALSLSRGRYIFLCDQDDVWFPNKIKEMIDYAETLPDKLVYMNDAEITDQHLNTLGISKYNQIKRLGLKDKTFVMGCCSLIKRELIDLCVPIPSNLSAHDNWIIGIADALDAKAINKKRLQFYRRHGKNTSTAAFNNIKHISSLDFFNHYLNIIRQKISNIDTKKIINERELKILKLKEISQKIDQKWIIALLNYIKELEYLNELESRRLYVRNLSLFRRILNIYKIYIEGEYKRASGIRSAIRDFIGSKK
jgi:glycosyltransferase involved in cell wall biosynthesis